MTTPTDTRPTITDPRWWVFPLIGGFATATVLETAIGLDGWRYWAAMVLVSVAYGAGRFEKSIGW